MGSACGKRLPSPPSMTSNSPGSSNLGRRPSVSGRRKSAASRGLSQRHRRHVDPPERPGPLPPHHTSLDGEAAEGGLFVRMIRAQERPTKAYSARRFGTALSFPGNAALQSASVKKKSPNITALSTPCLWGRE